MYMYMYLCFSCTMSNFTRNCALTLSDSLLKAWAMGAYDEGPLSQLTVCVASSVMSSHVYVGRSASGCQHCSLEMSRSQLSISYWSSFCLGFCPQSRCKPCILVWLQRFLHLPFTQRSPPRTSSGVHDPNHAPTSGMWRNWCVVSSQLRLPVLLLIPFSWWSKDLHSYS